MTERASIFQGVQIGVEGTPGTAAAANKKLQSLSIEPAIAIETLPFRAMGSKFPAIVTPNKEWVKAPIKGVPLYTEIVYPLASVLSYAAPAQQGGTDAYLWTFDVDTDGPDTVKTFTVEQGGSVRAHKFAYGLVAALNFMFSRAGNEIGGEMIGNALSDGITMTTSPSEIDLVPVLPTHVNVYLADAQADLDAATALTRALSASWAISDRFGPLFPLASAFGTGYAAVVETEPKLEVKLKLEADSAGMALLTTLRAGSTKFIRIKAVGDQIGSTGYYYTLQIDTAIKLQQPSAFTDEDGVYAIEFAGLGVHDATWGKATQIKVINDLTSL